jgi:hypothetical protein
LKDSFDREYQRWYTEATTLLRQVIPDRLPEFIELYMGKGNRKSINVQTYTIQDWLNGLRNEKPVVGEKPFQETEAIYARFRTQQAIVGAANARFESSLFDIKQLLQVDLFDSEIEVSRELLSRGFVRAAGAVAGVVLEKHLAQVCENHKVALKKKHAMISSLNDALKDAGVLDIPAWRQIQRLGDLRNFCDHDKERDPTNVEVEELIAGADKLAKTLF